MLLLPSCLEKYIKKCFFLTQFIISLLFNCPLCFKTATRAANKAPISFQKRASQWELNGLKTKAPVGWKVTRCMRTEFSPEHSCLLRVWEVPVCSTQGSCAAPHTLSWAQNPGSLFLDLSPGPIGAPRGDGLTVNIRGVAATPIQ